MARSSGVAESGRLVRRMSHRVDPAAIAEEARTVRLDAVFGPPRRSVPVGHSSPESRTLTPLIMVSAGIVLKLPRVSAPANASATTRDEKCPRFSPERPPGLARPIVESSDVERFGWILMEV